MYSITPYYEYPVKVEKSTCMYEMKNVYSNQHPESEAFNPMVQKAVEPEAVTVDAAERSQIASLERRQISLINQLKDLTQLLKNIKGKLLAGPPNKIGPVVQPLKVGHLLDAVIYASPKSSLLSFLTLSKWLQQRFSVTVHVHLHSTLKSVEKYLSNIIEGQKSNTYKRTSNELIITVILKEDVDVPQLIVSTKQRVPIAGEMNILRYLATLIWPLYSFEDPVRLTQVDQWLDLAHVSLHEGLSEKDLMDKLNSHLSRNKYLVGNSLSIADLGLLSTISRLQMAAKLPQHVKRWKENCCSDSGIKFAWETLTSV